MQPSISSRRLGARLGLEANAVTDNPLVLVDTGEIVSGWNFHAEPVAVAADQIATRAPRGSDIIAKSWLTEAPLRMLMNNLDPESKTPVSVGLLGNAAEIFPELVRRSIRPDIVTDQTSAQDPINGYLRKRWTLTEWETDAQPIPGPSEPPVIGNIRTRSTKCRYATGLGSDNVRRQYRI